METTPSIFTPIKPIPVALNGKARTTGGLL
jgi:hypothetical protein